MRIPIDPSKGKPIYDQIKDYLRDQILTGQLQPGTRLPATRTLAKDLGVSRITVLNAYADLESEGLIGSQPGSGTFVLAPMQIPASSPEEDRMEWPLWQQEFSGAGDQTEGSAPPNSRAHAPDDLISFTGVGAPDQYPVKDFLKALRTILSRDGVSALDYGEFGKGYPPLRQTITHVLASQGIRTSPDNILITSGSQQAIHLVCQILLKPGDVIITEKPTYNLALEMFRALKIKVIGIPVDEYGMQVELLEPLIQQVHPKLIYTIPNFQNPSGMCMSRERRNLMVQLAARYNLPILEDDFVGDLRYDGRALPAIKSLSPAGQVIYVGTFSKMLMPGLRVGYLAAEGPVLKHLVSAKQAADLTTSMLIQRTLHEYVTVGRYQVHLRRSTRLYRKRRDTILAAIAQFLPENVQVIPPQGGLFVWLRLPKGYAAADLLAVARETGVEFAPGERFFPEPEEGTHYLRLNFASQMPEHIREGIRRLGKAMAKLR